jgi:hypothetical protein
MSVDLEALINQSKERLNRHKEYLDRTAERAAGTSRGDLPLSLSPLRTVTYDGGVPAAPAYSPVRSPVQQQQQQQQQRQQQPYYTAPAPATHARALSPATKAQQRRDQPRSQLASAGAAAGALPPNPDSPSFSSWNPYGSRIARAGHANFGEPGAGGGDGSPRSGSRGRRRGHYVTGRTPTKVYDRGQRFVEGRQAFLERERHEAGEREMRECTFSPFVSRKAAAAQGAGGSAGGSASGSAPATTRRSKGSGAGESLSPDGTGGAAATAAAAPGTAASAVGDLGPGSDFLEWCVATDRANIGFHVDAPSVFLHIQRQQDARRARADGEAKLAIDTSHWRPRQTVPQEFHFGRSDQPIRSLRKPVLQAMVRLDSSRDGAGSNSGRAGSRSPRDRSRQATPRAGASSKSPQRGGGDDEGDDERKRERLRALELQTAARQQREQLKDQSDEIARLHGLVATLRMESEAAKAKVREMALAATIQGDAK